MTSDDKRPSIFTRPRMYKPCKERDVKLPTSTGEFAGFLVAINSIIIIPPSQGFTRSLSIFRGFPLDRFRERLHEKDFQVSFRREFFSLRLDLGMPSYEDFCERYCDFQLVEETFLRIFWRNPFPREMRGQPVGNSSVGWEKKGEFQRI